MATNDPLESADNPVINLPGFWGQVQLDSFFAILQKGVGKVPFDPQQHSIDKRVTAIDINIMPLPEQNIQYPINRGMIAESKEWAGTVLPSIKALGITTRELNGKWVHVKTVGLGSTYTNKNGDLKERTTFVFDKLFKNDAECTADWKLHNTEQGNPVVTPDGSVPPVSTPAPAPVNPDVKERETAMQFLKVIVGSACKNQTDINVIKKTIDANVGAMPLINKFFNVNSPETIELIAKEMIPAF